MYNLFHNIFFNLYIFITRNTIIRIIPFFFFLKYKVLKLILIVKLHNSLLLWEEKGIIIMTENNESNN